MPNLEPSITYNNNHLLSSSMEELRRSVRENTLLRVKLMMMQALSEVGEDRFQLSWIECFDSVMSGLNKQIKELENHE